MGGGGKGGVVIVWGGEVGVACVHTLRKNECSCQCDDFQIACYVLTTGPKTYQNPSFT